MGMVKSCGMHWISGTNLIAFLCTMQYCTEQGKKQYIEPDFMMTYIGNRSILFLQVTKNCFYKLLQNLGQFPAVCY